MSKDTAALEALLFASGEPLSREKIAECLNIGVIDVANLLRDLDKELKGHGIILREVSDGWQLSTKQEFFSTIEKLSETVNRRLSSSMMETLSIIAFLQPVTKVEIERIRGVKADKLIAKLIDFDLIEETGRKQVIGRPILYSTTENFLRCFGLKSLKDLPDLPPIESP